MKKVLLWCLGIFVAIQLIPVDRTNKPVDGNKNLVTVLKPSVEVAQILKNACYDCHSNEVKYPKYAYIAPISWSIKHHINEGRERVNFSEWMNYNADQKKHILEEIIETVESKEMPLKGYLPMHPEANLTDVQRKILNDYFKDLQQSGKY